MTNGVIFQYIPGTGLAAPGQFFEVNSGGQYQPTTRIVLQGHATAAGSLALDTPTPVASQNDADAFAGPGSMLREMFRLAAANAPAQPIWIEAVADPGTPPAQWTLTVATLPAPGQGVIEICGRQIPIAVSTTDTTATVAASLGAAINAFYDTLTNAMLPLTATVATNVVTLLARHAGAIMNDVDIYNSTAPSNVLGATGVLTVAQPVLGTGTPTLSSALAALGDDPADFVASPFSDAINLAAASIAFNDTSGRWSWSRQSYGHYWTVSTSAFSALTTLGLSLNDRHELIIGRFPGSVTPSWEWVAGRTALESTWLSDVTTGNVSRNQTGRVVQGVRGPRSRSGLWNYSARNTLLNSGISTTTIDTSGNVMIDKTVTCYRVGTSGQPDTVFRDIQAIYQAAGGIQYIRAMLAVEQGQKSFAASNPGNLAAISTPSDIKGTFVHAYTDLVDRGVFQDADTFTRNLIVQANASNPARCDVLAPIERVNPLDILAVNATFYQQYPTGF
ncbi:phage tail sheath subtilisin-like domain-containing protein [Methylocella tundrae]|uniref:Mu-like prophage tail sheath protein gpL n=1 Tax=Methylocella tundrae TaxID=227605 RepID=A0A4U8YY41_METTU|nr:phage tail sheath subtilisin-like domain-containing protein [Methylocella tundrae]WPP05507.1 hypothetical protein SIN04_06695 [Methylocella tundrae]VFU07932.1 Mu-like prophage tail sheath protein gpL [Methylocella tundrae]